MKFAQSLEADYPILADPEKEIAVQYGVVTPAREYPQRWTFYIGTDGKLLYVDREVKPASAGADVAARLTALGVAKRKPPKS